MRGFLMMPVFLVMHVFFDVRVDDAVDDWDSVNGKVNHSEGWDG